jgi:dienelactone hydrolase
MKLFVVFVWILGVCSLANAEELPGTAPLEWPEEDLSARLMDGAHRFVEQQIANSEQSRGQRWHYDFSSRDAYSRSIEPNRERFRVIHGVVDSRLPPGLEYYGDDQNPTLVAETSLLRVWQVRWPVLEGIWGCGLFVEPRKNPVACVVLLPDAAETPEQLLGLAPGGSNTSLARRLAENQMALLVPVTISREKIATDDEQLKRSDQTYREWIYRQAFHLGRHVIGYEIQIVMAAVDYFKNRYGNGIPIGVCGYAEGGLTALHAAAIDVRIDAALVSGYFDRRQNVWSEPIYRNLWGRLREFGDAEIASLIAPRGLVIEHAAVPEITGHKGDWKTADLPSVRQEFARIPRANSLTPPLLITPQAGSYGAESAARLAALLGVKQLTAVTNEPLVDRRKDFSPAVRHNRLWRELEGHVQKWIQRSDRLRDESFLYQVMPELASGTWSTNREHPTRELDKFVVGAKPYRQKFLNEAMGKFDEPLLPFHPRTRVVARSEKWIAYDVVLDVYPELFAWGVLVLPKDLKPGERRPVVVCQHGRHGLPREMVDLPSTAYNHAAAVLAERGFITFAPHNLYRGEDRYRWLSRKANTVHASLFSFIIASHDQILRWLEAQPFVDGERMAFYGLSYGGETAVRVPTILEKYCLSICSGDFNQWTRKVASTEEPFSFMRTIEWEMPYWNLGQTFDYAEMAYLMLPRPFMVERGHHDRVGRDPWVAHEYAKVRWLYTQLGIADRTEIEFFNGGHSMRLEGTVEFLHKHLRWPKPGDTR